MKKSVLVSVSVLSLLACVPAKAADIGQVVLPAVSGPNGKIEASGGWAGLQNFNSSAVFRGGASISLPLAERFGLQLDAADVNEFNTYFFGGTAHLFTRDPNSYLLGIIGGAAGTSNNASFYYVGPEVELYANNISFEATGGYLNADVAGIRSDKFFAIADLAFYATDDFRLTVGASSIAGFASGHIGAEYMISDVGLPLSLTADARVGQDNYIQGTVGVKIYFGGPDKSLIRRHREDDPRNRSIDIFNAAGNAFTPPPPPAVAVVPPPVVTPPVCAGEIIAGECIVPLAG